mmetsp:Transcript_14996/g.23261  ORF Transcript_14996/g.23261 Transcript_14996/m.23261 type:complete len:125 (+) Transcript_14996:375-749(+)
MNLEEIWSHFIGTKMKMTMRLNAADYLLDDSFMAKILMCNKKILHRFRHVRIMTVMMHCHEESATVSNLLRLIRLIVFEYNSDSTICCREPMYEKLLLVQLYKCLRLSVLAHPCCRYLLSKRMP